ncbi:hypothetical protein [Baaleninema sp.]|uniref:hypothetical protein n=1 Tax=Baaleninema sp. TaxID=3101197 RepID=UPI003D01526F
MKNFDVVMSVLGFVFTTLWGIWTWRQQYNREQQQKRDKIAALYVNPFLVACDQLQSRIYNILERQGLEYLRQRYPDGQYAEETLYLIAHFFGWEHYIFRYGPYTRDPNVIDRTNRIRSVFARDILDGTLDPFCFRRQEQVDLGKLVVRKNTSNAEIENISLDSISLYEFMETLKEAPYRNILSVQTTLNALQQAKTAKDLIGCERLAEIHKNLVELLDYLEHKEGFSLFENTRKIAKPTV